MEYIGIGVMWQKLMLVPGIIRIGFHGLDFSSLISLFLTRSSLSTCFYSPARFYTFTFSINGIGSKKCIQVIHFPILKQCRRISAPRRNTRANTWDAVNNRKMHVEIVIFTRNAKCSFTSNTLIIYAGCLRWPYWKLCLSKGPHSSLLSECIFTHHLQLAIHDAADIQEKNN